MIVVYTALFGDYDDLRSVPKVSGVRFVAFTDRLHRASGWEYIFPRETEATNALECRKYKTQPHVMFPSADWTIYVDANLTIKASPHAIVKECLPGLNVFRHNRRDCAYAEAEIVRPRVSGVVLDNQLKRYRQEGFPQDYGLFWGGLLIRSAESAAFNDRWWREVKAGVFRDQVSLPYVMWKTDIPFHVLSGGIPFYGDTNRFCRRRPHTERRINRR